MTVEGMHDHWNAAQPRGNTSDQSRLRGMGMDDIRLLTPDEPPQPIDCEQVTNGRYFAAQAVNNRYGQMLLVGDITHIALIFAYRPAHKLTVIACVFQARYQLDHIDSSATDVQAGNDVHHLHAGL